MKRMILAVGVLTALVLPSVAQTHVIETAKVKFWSGDVPLHEKCGEMYANIAHGNWGKGFARSNTYALVFEPVFGGCKSPWYRDAHSVGSRFVYQKRNNGNWNGCDSSDWQWNRANGFWIESYRNYGNVPCGHGTYRTFGVHDVMWHDNHHQGFNVTPGSHDFKHEESSVVAPDELTAPEQVLDADGNPIKCPDGRYLLVSMLQWANSPSLGESEYMGRPSPGHDVFKSTEGTVPRCTTARLARKAGGPEPIVWVPERVGQKHKVAPRRYRRP